MTESQKTRITQIADIVADQQNVSLPEGARPRGLNRLAYVLEKAAGIIPVGGRTDLGRLFDCFKSGQVSISDTPELPASIAVKTMPEKVNYVVGDSLDTTGLSFTLTYNTGDTRVISSGFVAEPEELSTEGTQEITVSYTENETTVSCAFEVTVEAAEVEEGPAGETDENGLEEAEEE